MKRAQMERRRFAPEKYRHYYRNEIPERYRDQVKACDFFDGRAYRVSALHPGRL